MLDIIGAYACVYTCDVADEEPHTVVVACMDEDASMYMTDFIYALTLYSRVPPPPLNVSKVLSPVDLYCSKSHEE